MTKIILSDDAARAVVKAGTTPVTKSIQKVSKIQDAPSQGGASEEILPFRLVSEWTQVNGLWQGSAVYIDPATGNPISGTSVTVYCPAASGKPEGEAYSWRFWAKWNSKLKRWESLQQPVYSNTYVAGDIYISVGSYDSTLNGYPIRNEGLTNAKVASDNIYDNTKTLYFSGGSFKWVQSSLDIVGKKELAVKTSSKTVVTGISSSGNTITLTTESISVVGS